MFLAPWAPIGFSLVMCDQSGLFKADDSLGFLPSLGLFQVQPRFAWPLLLWQPPPIQSNQPISEGTSPPNINAAVFEPTPQAPVVA